MPVCAIWRRESTTTGLESRLMRGGLLQHHSRAASAFAVGRDAVSKGVRGSGNNAAVLLGPSQLPLSRPTDLFSAELTPRTHMSKKKRRSRHGAVSKHDTNIHALRILSWRARGSSNAAGPWQHANPNTEPREPGASPPSSPHNLNPKLQGVGRARQGKAGQSRLPVSAVTRQAQQAGTRLPNADGGGDVHGGGNIPQIAATASSSPHSPRPHDQSGGGRHGGRRLVAIKGHMEEPMASRGRPLVDIGTCHEPRTPIPAVDFSAAARGRLGSWWPRASRKGRACLPDCELASFDLLPSKPGASRLPLSKTAAHEDCRARHPS